MVVVSNTSPLSNLAIIGRLDLLRVQVGKVERELITAAGEIPD